MYDPPTEADMLATTIVVLQGAQASSVAITLDVLAAANRVCAVLGNPPAFDVRLSGSGAAVYRPLLSFPEAQHESPELLIVPALGCSNLEMPTKSLIYRERLSLEDALAACGQIREALQAGSHVASSCTGTLLVASTGKLARRRVTTAWWLAPVFREMFPDIVVDTEQLVVSDGSFTTAGAGMSQVDLMVKLVARFAGANVADFCVKRMVLDERRSQVPYMAMGLLAASDEKVEKAAAWVKSRLDQAFDINDVASAVGLSGRTFYRRVVRATGLSPVQFLRQLRLEHAIELIRSTPLAFEEIAFRVGYADASTLRSLIRRTMGVGPRELRSKAPKNVEAKTARAARTASETLAK
jgi:transcriptional regulator GlxA family with amidase domain